MRPRCLLLLLVTPMLWCHDFWIEPSSFRPAAGGPLLLRLRVGQFFHGDPVPRLEELALRFSLWDAGGERPVPGSEGMDPAGMLRAGQGPTWICYYSKPSTVELEAARFEAYLREEGLEAIARLRARRGETGRDATDHFIRCAKAYLAGAGPAGKGAYAHAFGLPLELTLEADPASAALLPVRLTFQGRPVQGALVTAYQQGAPGAAAQLRTDAGGRARLPLAGPGRWLVKSTHMEPEGAGQWRSYWASVTFQHD